MTTLDALGVGVEGRVEGALGGGEVAQDEVQGLGDHAEIVAVPRGLPSVQVGPGQQRLVGEHLLEVGHEPLRRPSSTGRTRRRGGRRCRRPPWRRASAAPWRGRAPRRRSRSHPRTPSVRPAGGTARPRWAGGIWAPARSRPTRESKPAARPATTRAWRESASTTSGPVVAGGPRPAAAFAAVPTGVGDGASPASSWLRISASGISLRTAPTSASACVSTWSRSFTHASPSAWTTRRNAGHAVALLGREVRPGVEGAPVGGAEDGHGPPARAGQGLGGRHVDGVEVGPLLPVDLDRDEPPGQVRRGRRVLEALVGHDVAPVARGVADGEEDRLVLVAGQAQGLVPPGEPLHRVVGVLAKIRAGLVGQVVHGRDARALSSIGPTRVPRARLGRWSLNSGERRRSSPGGSRGIGLAMAGRFARGGCERHDHVPDRRGPGRRGGGARRGRCARGAGGVDGRPRRSARGRARPASPRRWPGSAASTSWSTTPAPIPISAR